MLRVTKKMNYILLSPTQAQVASQAPMECIPLVMEPLSGYYVDPVVVLDFQVEKSFTHYIDILK
jgi:DNA polymerase zeta